MWHHPITKEIGKCSLAITAEEQRIGNLWAHSSLCHSLNWWHKFPLDRKAYDHVKTCIVFFFFFFKFIILYWFCHISTWICHRYTCVPHPEPPPSSLPIPSLWVVPVHQPQASSIVHRTWTGDSFHIWYYTYFNAILQNHPTPLLSHRVPKTVLYISVSFAESFTGLLLPSF